MLDTDFIRRSLKDSKCLKHFSHYNVNCMFKKKNYKSSVCRSSAGCQEFLKSSYGRQIYNTINRQPGLKMYNINIHQPTSSYDIISVTRSHMKLLSCLESEFALPEEFPHYVDLINMVVGCLEVVALMKRIHHKQTFKGTITFLMQNEVCQLR